MGILIESPFWRAQEWIVQRFKISFALQLRALRNSQYLAKV